MLYTLTDLLCVAAAPLVAELVLCRFFHRDRSAKKTVLILLFTLYMAEVFDIVGIQSFRYLRWNPSVNFVPFAERGEPGFLFQTIANAILFMPFGFMLPLIWRRFRRFPATALAGLLTSVCIETAQLFSYRATDIDDLLMNTLGTVVGYLLAALYARRRWKNDAASGGGRDVAELIVAAGIVFLSAMFISPVIARAIYGLI